MAITYQIKNKLISFFKSISSTYVMLGVTIIVFLWAITHSSKHNVSPNIIAKPNVVYVDKYGDRHILLHTIEVDKAEMQKLKNDKALLGTKIGKLDRLLSIAHSSSSIDTEFIIVPSVDDSCNFSIEKKDEYIHLWAKGNKKIGEIGITSKDTITYVEYTKFHFFKANQRMIDIKNKNPYNILADGTHIALREHKPLISLGIQIGYNPITQKPYLGVGAQINILTIKYK